jgi:hypothetical protein
MLFRLLLFTPFVLSARYLLLRELRKDADVEKHIRHRLKQETHAKQRERRSSASNNTARTQQAILNSTVVLDRKLAEEQTVEGDAMEPVRTGCLTGQSELCPSFL